MAPPFKVYTEEHVTTQRTQSVLSRDGVHLMKTTGNPETDKTVQAQEAVHFGSRGCTHTASLDQSPLPQCRFCLPLTPRPPAPAPLGFVPAPVCPVIHFHRSRHARGLQFSSVGAVSSKGSPTAQMSARDQIKPPYSQSSFSSFNTSLSDTLENEA